MVIVAKDLATCYIRHAQTLGFVMFEDIVNRSHGSESDEKVVIDGSVQVFFFLIAVFVVASALLFLFPPSFEMLQGFRGATIVTVIAFLCLFPFFGTWHPLAPSYSSDNVLRVLSRQWQSGQSILDQLRLLQPVREDGSLESHLIVTNLATVEGILDSLISQQLVVRATSNWERPKVRRYQLTERGIRRQEEVTKKIRKATKL